MANLPQFHEWVTQRIKEDQAPNADFAPTPRPGESKALTSQESAGGTGAVTETGARRNRIVPEPPEEASTATRQSRVSSTSLATMFQQSLDEWNDQMNEVKTDELLKDGSMYAAAHSPRLHWQFENSPGLLPVYLDHDL